VLGILNFVFLTTSCNSQTGTESAVISQQGQSTVAPVQSISIQATRLKEVYTPEQALDSSFSTSALSNGNIELSVDGGQSTECEFVFSPTGASVWNNCRGARSVFSLPILFLSNGDLLVTGDSSITVQAGSDPSITHALVPPSSPSEFCFDPGNRAVQTKNGTIVVAGESLCSGQLYFFNPDYSFQVYAPAAKNSAEASVVGLVALSDGGVLVATDLSIVIVNPDGSTRFRDDGQLIPRSFFSDGEGFDFNPPFPLKQLEDGTIAIGIHGSTTTGLSSAPDINDEHFYFLSPSGKLVNSYALHGDFTLPYIQNDQSSAILDRTGVLHLLDRNGNETSHLNAGFVPQYFGVNTDIVGAALLDNNVLALNLGSKIDLIGVDGRLLSTIPATGTRSYNAIIPLSDDSFAVSFGEGASTPSLSDAVGLEYWQIEKN